MTTTLVSDFKPVDSRQMGTTIMSNGALITPAATATSSPTIFHHDPELASVPPLPNTNQPYSKWFHQKGDPAVHRARRIYLKTYISGLVLVILAVFAVFPIYWGSLWKVPAHALNGWIVDFDGGDVGQTIVQDLTSSGSKIIHWTVRPSTDFPRGPVDVINLMKDDQAWAAITINEGASARLQDALLNPDASYNGSSAITAYGVEARNENAYRTFIRPAMQASLDAAKLRYATSLAQGLSTSSLNLMSLLSTSPQAIVNPVSYTLVNLIPFNQPVASAVVFVGLIYLLILSFFLVMIAHGAREASGVNKMLHLRSLITVRIVTSCFGYLFLSFFYSLLNLAFKLDLTRRYGHGGFMLFWMLNWVGMLAVGLALESLITLLTPKFIPFFMILWIIVNVSVCILPIDILPRIYHYGYAVPFYNISNSTRSIAFGTRNTLGLNFGVLLAWVVISCVTLPALQWYVRRSEIRAMDRRRPELNPIPDSEKAHSSPGEGRNSS